MIHHLSLEQILHIHGRMIEKYGGSPGIRDQGLLESAIMRPQTSAFGEDAYPTLSLKAAVLLHSLIKNHPFVDGNKRTGFGAMHLMLLTNGWDLTSETDEEVTIAIRVATGDYGYEQAALWIEENSRKTKNI